MSLSPLVGMRLDLSAEQRQLVRGALQSVLDSPHFRKSKRYPALLEFAVRAALEDNSNPLKERTVGVEVFGRPADYDTSIDPVVRIAAGEVRRRMAHYFSEHPETPVRIDLPPGSYKAEFHFKSGPANVIGFQQPSIHADPEETSPVAASIQAIRFDSPLMQPESKDARHWLSKKATFIVTAALVLIAGAVGTWRNQQDGERQGFWWPVLHNDQPALILVGKTGAPPSTTRAGSGLRPASSTSGGLRDLALNDAIVTAQICSAFREYKRECTVAPAELAKVDDLHGKSLVLVGGFNNPWTRRILASLRYQLQTQILSKPTAHVVRSVVEHDPTGDVPLGVVGNEDPTADFDKDYAIIARFHSDITDGMAVVVAGVGRPGTSSAGEFLSSPDKLRELYSQAPKGWNGTNFEAVLKIDLVQGNSNHVDVIASHFW